MKSILYKITYWQLDGGSKAIQITLKAYKASNLSNQFNLIYYEYSFGGILKTLPNRPTEINSCS